MGTNGRWRWLAGVLLVLTVGERVALEAGPPPPPSCRLRAFLFVEQDVLTPEEKDVVREEIARIWRPYGLAFEWRAIPGEYVPGTVSINIRDTFLNTASAKSNGGVVVAWTMFTQEGPLPFIRASMSAARIVAASARVGGRDVMLMPELTQRDFFAKVIGRSIAHELGHYLLGRGHAEFGLMRAVIPPDDYFGARLNFALTPKEIAALPRSAVWRACTSEAAARIPAR